MQATGNCVRLLEKVSFLYTSDLPQKHLSRATKGLEPTQLPTPLLFLLDQPFAIGGQASITLPAFHCLPLWCLFSTLFCSYPPGAISCTALPDLFSTWDAVPHWESFLCITTLPINFLLHLPTPPWTYTTSQTTFSLPAVTGKIISFQLTESTPTQHTS